MSRESFLARVRAAAGAGRAHRVFAADKPLPPISPSRTAAADLVAQMAAEVNQVGGHSHVVPDAPAAARVLAELLEQSAATKALCWRDPLLARIGLAELLHERGVQLLDYDALLREPVEGRKPLILAAEIGISGAAWAVAETGTLAMASGPGRERLASLAPPLHVAVIEARQIVPDLFALFAHYEVDALPSNLTLITGPSKTGDIEMELTTGVHGPGQWHVIIVAGALQ
ncbi:MAG TPA: lactate utilization protein [Pirellulales bacterium]